MAIENEQYVKNSLNKYLYTTPIYSDFKGGLNKLNNQSEININELYTANNIILNKDMGLYGRGGVSKLIETQIPEHINSTVNGLFHARFSKGDKLIACINYFIYVWHNNNWVLLTSNLTRQSCSNYCFAFLNDNLIITDGVNKPVRIQYDGSNFTVSELNDAPITKFVVAYQSRLFFAGDNTNKLYFSSVTDLTSYPLENTISIGGSIDNSYITSITSVLGYLVIFKKNSTYYLSGSSNDTFTITQLSNSIGCLYDNCSCEAENNVYFLGQNGIYRITSGMSIEFLSQKIYTMFQNVTQSFLPKIIHNPYMRQIWCIVGYGSGTDYLVFVYDLVVNAFSTYTFYKDENVNIFPLIIAKYYNSDGNIKIIGCNDKDRYVRIYDSEYYGVRDDGYDSYAEIETKLLNLGDPLKYKSIVYYTAFGSSNENNTNYASNSVINRFDASNNTNTQLSYYLLNTVRSHTSEYSSNKIYVVGGFDGKNLNKLQIIDLTNSNVYYGADIPIGISGHCSVLWNNKIYVFGGFTTNDIATNNVYVYDILSNSWTKLDNSKNMPTSRGFATATLYNNKVYIIGGYDNSYAINKIEVFDLINETWETKNNLPNARTNHSAILFNNNIYLFGGYPSVNYKNVTIYDIQNDSFTDLGNIMPQELFDMCGINFNNYGYLFNGYNPITAKGVTNIYKFDTNDNSFTNVCNTIYENYRLSLCKDSQYIYNIGGISLYDAKIYFKYTNDFSTVITKNQNLVLNSKQPILNEVSNYLYKFISIGIKIKTGYSNVNVRGLLLDYFMWSRRE